MSAKVPRQCRKHNKSAKIHRAMFLCWLGQIVSRSAPSTSASKAFLAVVLKGVAIANLLPACFGFLPTNNCEQHLSCSCFQGRRHRICLRVCFCVFRWQLWVKPFLQLFRRCSPTSFAHPVVFGIFICGLDSWFYDPPCPDHNGKRCFHINLICDLLTPLARTQMVKSVCIYRHVVRTSLLL